MIVSSALSVGLATWGCRYRELQPVFFGGRILGAGDGASAASTGQQEHHRGDLEAQEGDDAGYTRGSTKGRGKDGQGEYEMVQMKKNAS